MPGKVIFLDALELATNRPAALAWLVIVVSNLGAVLLYLFVRDLLDDRRTALLSLVFYLFVPARTLFMPVANIVTPVFIIGWAWLWVRWLRSQSAAMACVLGVALYAVVFYEPTPLVMGMLFLCLTAQALVKGTLTVRPLFKHGAIGAASFAVTHAAMRAIFRFDVLTTFRAIALEAARFNAESQRPFWTWVWQNPIDFLFGAGICQAVLLCVCAAAVATRPGLWQDPSSRRIAALIVGIVASLVAVDLIGLNRGEVVRLWIFLACFAQIPAAYACARVNSRAAAMAVVGTSVLQTAIATSMMAFGQP
jgi:hypothetical protein